MVQARTGRGGVLFVVGEPGLGKTSVLKEVRSRAGEDFRVGLGSADPMDASRPFGLLGAAFEELGGGEVLQHGSDQRSDLGYAALRWLEASAPEPMLLALDDVHWSDPDSLDLLSFLCRRAERLPLAIVATLRPGPAEVLRMTDELGAGRAARALRLTPLSEEATCQLLRDRLGTTLDGDRCRHVWRACAGNPLLLEQAVAARLDLDSLDLPAGELLMRRFADLDRRTMNCARVASVLGARFRTDMLALLARIDASEAGAAVETMRQSGLLSPGTGKRCSFVHPLFQQVLYDDLGEARRRRLHRRAYEVLAELGRHAEAAEHARRARPEGDLRAVALLKEQGELALNAGAPSTAAGCLESAVALIGADAGAAMLLALARARAMAGQYGAAVVAYERALDRPELTTEERAATLHQEGRALFALGEQERAEAQFNRSVRLSAKAIPELAVRSLLDQALTAWLTTGPAYSLPLAVAADEIARNASATARSQVTVARGFLSFLQGDGGGIDTAATAAGELGERVLDTGDMTWSWGVMRTYAVGAWLAERFEEADLILDRVRDEAERQGSVEGFVAAGIGRLDPLIQRGRLREAVRLTDQLEPLVDLLPVTRAYVDMRAAAALLHLDRHRESRASWERAMAAATEWGQRTAVLYLLEVQARRSWREGRADEAAELYERLEGMEARLGIGEPCLVRWARFAVLTYVELGRIADARRVTDALAERAGRLPCRWPRIALASARAALAEARGRHEQAGRCHRHALELHSDVPLELERVETLLEFGAFLSRRARPDEARTVLRQAVAVATEHGAEWLARLARDRLADLG